MAEAAHEVASGEMSQQERLADLIAQATALYAVKDYVPAAELYAEAAELQAEMNGEMSIDNADLLYSYGKCLYFVAVKTSDVLGSEAAGGKLGGKNTTSEKKTSQKRKANGEPSDAAIILNRPSSSTDREPETLSELVEGGATDVVPETDIKPPQPKPEEKPYFQFEGDENYADSDEDEEAEEQEGDEIEEDDFANAFEVLDLSRLLLLRKLNQMQEPETEESEKGKSATNLELTPEVRQIKERIADVHDLQAEISFEGEKFSNAVVDLKASLALKEELYPYDSSVLAECHYKLSLALEFSSVTQQHDPDGNPVGEAIVDKVMREEAAVQMEKAIESCKSRIAKEEKEVDSITDLQRKEKALHDIEDVREMVADMEQRLVELRKPPINIKAESNAGLDKAGIMQQILGGNKTIEEVTQKATDLTGIVKKKKKVGLDGRTAESTPEPSSITLANGSAKRKVSFEDETVEIGTGKKAKVEHANGGEL